MNFMDLLQYSTYQLLLLAAYFLYIKGGNYYRNVNLLMIIYDNLCFHEVLAFLVDEP